MVVVGRRRRDLSSSPLDFAFVVVSTSTRARLSRRRSLELGSPPSRFSFGLVASPSRCRELLRSDLKSVLQTYRCDLAELGSGLKNETSVFRHVASCVVEKLPASLEVGTLAAQASWSRSDKQRSTAQASLEVGTVWKSTTKIVSHAKECSQSNTCIYELVYGDKSYTAGYFSKDKLTITSNDVFDGFLFGCGQENVGFLEGPAGLHGLSRNMYSMVEQTADKFSRSFSYCLPPTASSTGFLSFGTPVATSDATITYTKLVTLLSEPSFYGLHMVGINVNGRKLSIPASVFSSPGTIIDSGTVISRLPSTTFNALNEAFKAAMTSYPSAPGVGILKTCYDFSGYSTVKYPKIEFVSGDGVTLTLDATGIVYLVDERKVCLAYTGNENADDYTVFGNTQQKNMEVFYDVAGERVGFSSVGC